LFLNDQVIWGPNWSSIAKALFNQSLDQLRIEAEADQDELGDGIVVGEVMSDVHMIPGFWKIEGYSEFCQELCSSVGLRKGSNFFTFPYDWRRDNRVSARRLQKFVNEKMYAWRNGAGGPDAKLILIAHSMGGLVARYFIEVLGGWEDVRRLITLGTPHRGALNALGFLANGYAKKIGPLKVDATAVLRSFSSVYQLLPTYKCVDLEGTMYRINERSISSIVPDRVTDAFDFHREIEESEQANRKKAGYPTSYLSCLVSSRQPTFQSARLEGEAVELLQMWKSDDDGGDGTVPAISAIPKSFDQSGATYIWGVHGSLTNQQPVREAMIDALTAAKINVTKYRSAAELSDMAQVALHLDDAYDSGQMVPLIASVKGGNEQTLIARLTPLLGGEPVERTLFKNASQFEGEVKLMPGAWRVHVAGSVAQPADDLILVARTDGDMSSKTTV
jgi:pimeloyl-ACP methyl ester carboxylesterase